MSRFVVGVDVGGTFTDIFVLDRETGLVSTAKTPSTLQNQAEGFAAGVSELVPDFADIASIVHGTTTGTNALLERKGARTGIITTAGFRDVLEMRRRDRPTTWGLWGQYEPVVPRDLRLETPERVLADGTVLTPIDPVDIASKAEHLLAEGCEACCLFFINGHANQENEQAALAALRTVWPNDYVTAATDILPEIREFERLSTAALNAYLQPVVSSYLDHLDRRLTDKGFQGDLMIVQSNGGVMSVASARQAPVRTALSGPAAGVMAAKTIAAAAGYPNIITCDMGGTSFDVSLIASGEAALAAQTSIDFGLVIRAPMIEITTIGAGGGSIARVDGSGLLQVGPESAGSDPGPACYGRGSLRPTVTDANLVLGRINPSRPIGGGRTALDLAAARGAIESEIGAKLNLTVEEAAEAVLSVANAKMAGAIRLVSIERGHDPALFAAMPFGGGGALHAGALMLDVGLGAAIVPRFPGVTSALGCAVADMRHDRVRTVNAALDQVDAATLGAEMTAVAADLQAVLDTAGLEFERCDQVYELDMLYAGQTHTVAATVTIPDAGLDRAEIRRGFEAAYAGAFGRLLEGAHPRIMNYRVAVIGRRAQFDMSAFAPVDGRPADDCILERRQVRAAGEDLDAPVYDRLALDIGETITGPAILEQPDSTIFVDPGLTARVDDHGNLIITRCKPEDDRR